MVLFAGLLLVAVYGLFLPEFVPLVYAEQIEITPTVVLNTKQAIQKLQPMVSDERAERLAKSIDRVSLEHGIDPKLIVALIFRESSFHPDIENLRKNGPNGEIGLMQLNPVSRVRWSQCIPEGCPDTLEGADCQIATGTDYLAASIRGCPGSIWQGVFMYGSGQCVSFGRAAIHVSVRNAIRYYRMIGGIP